MTQEHKPCVRHELAIHRRALVVSVGPKSGCNNSDAMQRRYPLTLKYQMLRFCRLRFGGDFGSTTSSLCTASNACINRLKFSKAAGPVTISFSFVGAWVLFRIHCTPGIKFQAS